MDTQTSADAQLDAVRAELARNGMQVSGPHGAVSGAGQPDVCSLGVSDPTSGRYAEVSQVRHTPDPSTWYLQLSFWTDAAQDPVGLDMASRVLWLLSGPGEHDIGYRDRASGSAPAPTQEAAQ